MKLARPASRSRRYAASGVRRSVLIVVVIGVGIALQRRTRETKKTSAEALGGEVGCRCALAHAPASPLAPPPGAGGRRHRPDPSGNDRAGQGGYAGHGRALDVLPTEVVNAADRWL